MPRSPDHGRVRVFVQRPSSSQPVASDASVCVSSRASSSSLSSVATAAVATKAVSPRGPPASLSVLLQAASDDDTVRYMAGILARLVYAALSSCCLTKTEVHIYVLQPDCPSTVTSSHGSPPPSPTELQGAQALLSILC